jgi:hypothetical protein
MDKKKTRCGNNRPSSIACHMKKSSKNLSFVQIALQFQLADAKIRKKTYYNVIET